MEHAEGQGDSSHRWIIAFFYFDSTVLSFFFFGSLGILPVVYMIIARPAAFEVNFTYDRLNVSIRRYCILVSHLSLLCVALCCEK